MSTGNAPKKRRYRLYLDESGDHVYKNLDDPNSRFMALVGVWAEQSVHYAEFEQRLRAFKESIFGDRAPSVVFHRKDIVNKRGTFSILRHDDVSAKFDAGWLQIIAEAKYRCTCVIIDKAEHLGKYRKPFHPYHYALAAMLDRYCGWLRDVGGVGDVIAESRNPQENQALQQEYERIISKGTIQFSAGWHRPALTTTSIKFRNKKADAPGLELADSLAFPLRQWCLIEKGRVPDPGDVFGKRVVRACAPRLHRSRSSGRIEGYGSVWLPKDLNGPPIVWPVQ